MRTRITMQKRGRAFLALAAALAAVLATTTAGHATARSAPAAGTPRCHTGDLASQIWPATDSASDHHVYTFALFNVTRTTCHTRGHVGLGLQDRSARQLHTNVVWSGGSGDTITLLPGEYAWTTVSWTGEADCVPFPWFFEITPPDEYTHLTEAWPARGLGICDNGQLDETTPLQPGPGPNEPWE